MKALIQAHTMGGNDSNAVFEATRGIVYMGCPHMGTDLAAWTAFMAGLSSVSSRTVSFKPALCVNTQETFSRMLKECESKEEGKGRSMCCFQNNLLLVAQPRRRLSGERIPP
jgi:hypothetical protein